MNYAEKRRYVGNESQLFSVKEYRLCGGKSEGLHAVDVDNGSGLCFTVLADRCMDLGKVSFLGNGMNFMTACGYVAPAYFDANGANWLHSFTAGMMTTCGFSNIGSPCTDCGEALPLHGPLANTPAEKFSVCTEVENGVPVAVMRGTVEQASVFADKLRLVREIRCRYGENVIHIHDRIENIGWKDAPLMRLYHCNFGYPLLNENAELLIPSKKVIPRNDHAAEGIDRWDRIDAPTAGYEEMCYYHILKTDENGCTVTGVYNKELGVGAFVGFDTATLDHFVEWKMMGEGDYVLGLEPGNATIGGRSEARADGTLKYIKPGETVESHLSFTYIKGEDAFNTLKEKTAGYR